MANGTKSAGKRGNGLVFEFVHEGGVKVTAPGLGKSHQFLVRDASLECNHFAALKGWKSTFEDAAAKSRDTATGASAPIEERFAAVVEIMTHYANKDVVTWGRKAAAGTREATDAGLVLQALCLVKGWTVDEANAKVDRMAVAKKVDRKVVLAGLAKEPAIMREVVEIKARRAAASRVDSLSMLDELDELDAVDDEPVDDEAEAGEAPF